MTGPAQSSQLAVARRSIWGLVRSALFRKYALLIGAVMGTVLLASSLVDIWFTARDQRTALVRIQSEQAVAAAARITQFIKEIESQLGWLSHLSWTSATGEQREIDALRLLRQVPAISEVVLIDGAGRERLRMSRQAMDRVESNADLSADPRFVGAIAEKVHYGPLTFQRGTEPVITISLAGTRREAGVVSAVVNLTHIWDVIHRIQVGHAGRAYVVARNGRLLAHPDLSLVLRNTDMSHLPQVQAARATVVDRSIEQPRAARSIKGEPVLTAFAVSEPLKWMVFVELPEAEANEPVYATATRSVVIAMAGAGIALLAALVLAHRMVVPIQALSAGAARIGAGALDHRIAIETGDELEALGTQFNDMAAKVQSSLSMLERKVAERTRQLQEANLAKGRFLAAASHDLRQPLHALNLLVAHLESERNPAAKMRVAARIGLAVAKLNELLNALLDISRIDAGALAPSLADFPIDELLDRIGEVFGAAAREKGLHFAVVPSSVWVRSDPILLERILLNLVSNATRYTTEGGIVVGCRRRAGELRIDVCDTGIGIAPEQQQAIFAEFYRGGDQARGDGLGLGLAIVERLSTLLEHRIEVASVPGRGSRFSVAVPITVPHAAELVPPPRSGRPIQDHLSGKRMLVIDDDTLVLAGTGGLLESWGCEVVLAGSQDEAMARLGGRAPDLVISDYELRSGTGLEAIAAIRSTFGRDVPAFVISGNLAPSLYAEVRAGKLHLLHKPLTPSALRATVESLLRQAPAAGVIGGPAKTAPPPNPAAPPPAPPRSGC